MRRINKKKCDFCSHEFQGVSENFCSKKCLDAHEIVNNIQKIIYCVRFLREKNEPSKDPELSKIISILENSTSKIIDNVNSLEKEFRKND